MKNIPLLCLIGILTSCSSLKNISLESISKHQKIDETRFIVKTLSSDKLLGRKPGTQAYEETVSFVSAYFKTNKIKPFYKDSYKDSCLVKGKTSYNVVALIGERDNQKEHVLIGAHLDHLGISRNKQDSIFNGANDNASGVTAVLQIAKELNKYDFEQNIILVLFTGEESGLVGSKHLAQRLKKEDVNLSYIFNYEMIGKTLTTGPNQVYLTGYNKSNCAPEMNAIAGTEFVKFLPAETTYNLFKRSDNYPFYRAFKIPSHTISTFDFENYDHYHKESDEVNLLDIKNMNDVIHTSTFIISQLLVKNTQLKNNE